MRKERTLADRNSSHGWLRPSWADVLRWEMEAPGSVANSGASVLGQASVHAKQRVIPSQALRFNMKQ